MANKIRLNKINGKDTLANSIVTLNQNFKLLEDTLDTHIINGVSSLRVNDIVWSTSSTNGPSSNIIFSNGNTARINPIPSADESQSGVITTGEQTIAGVKTFKDGISTDSITDKNHHKIVAADGNTVYVGGNRGIKLSYDEEGNLTNVEYGFMRGVDLTQIITNTNSSQRIVEELRNQLDGKISTFYGEGLPPSTQQGLETYWRDSNENHINDEYKDTRSVEEGGGKTYIFAELTQDVELGEDDVEVTDTDYYWKLVSSSDVSNIINEFQDTYDEMLARLDNTIQIFGETDLPSKYDYGDIWFFGGVDKIIPENGIDLSNIDLSSFVAGNIYYCDDLYIGDSVDKFVDFDPTQWKIGSNSGDTTRALEHMSSSDWLSVTEKQKLSDDWYEIAGIPLTDLVSTNISNLISTIENSVSNPGSYYTLVQKYNRISDPSSDVVTKKGNIENALKDIYLILVACGCNNVNLVDSDLSTIDIPNGLNNNYGSGSMATSPTIISDVFNRYYTEVENIGGDFTNVRISETLANPETVQEISEGVGKNGFTLSSLIELEYDGVVVGGLDGITADNNNVGLWFGGTNENAKRTLNGTLPSGTNPLPVILTKNGLNSKIGPLKIGESVSNEHIYIGNSNSGAVTVIGTDYISMGATYTQSNTKANAEANAPIYLDRNGEGSKIGPLKVGVEYSNKILTFGNTTEVYSFRSSENKDSQNLGTRDGYLIDGHQFTDDELNTSVETYTNNNTIDDQRNGWNFDFDFDSLVRPNKDDHWMLPVNP